MQIIWHGQSCFEITTTPAKNSQVKIVIDPFSEEIGLKLPKLEADVVLTTHEHLDHNNVKAVLGSPSKVSSKIGKASPFLVDCPGEYEIKKVFIQGILSWHDDKEGKLRGPNTTYIVESEDLKLCHLGDFGQKDLTEEQLEKIGEVDILIIPIGGVYTISASQAIKIMSQIEPRIIIPMHYQIPKLKVKLDGLDKFLKGLGIKSIEPLAKFSIKKKDISPEEAKIIVLKP